jgi:hypothetical protein
VERARVAIKGSTIVITGKDKSAASLIYDLDRGELSFAGESARTRVRPGSIDMSVGTMISREDSYSELELDSRNIQLSGHPKGVLVPDDYLLISSEDRYGQIVFSDMAGNPCMWLTSEHRPDNYVMPPTFVISYKDSIAQATWRDGSARLLIRDKDDNVVAQLPSPEKKEED